MGSAILICIRSQSDPSGKMPQPHHFGVEVGGGLDGCVGPVQQIGPSSVSWSKCPFVLRHWINISHCCEGESWCWGVVQFGRDFVRSLAKPSAQSRASYEGRPLCTGLYPRKTSDCYTDHRKWRGLQGWRLYSPSGQFVPLLLGDISGLWVKNYEELGLKCGEICLLLCCRFLFCQ